MGKLAQTVRWSLMLGASLLAESSVLAQSAATPVGSEDTQRQLEEIVVTARRVAESLQTTPVAVTALSSRDIEQRFATNIADLEGLAPNMQISRDTTYPTVAQFTIRGETTLDPARYSEPAVIIAVDGVFLPSVNGALIDVFDLERLEILRGPQGTLFGRNTVGGVVNISRKRPSFKWGGALEATYGRWNRVNFKAAVDVPIIEDKLAARATFITLHGGGFARNLYYATDPTSGKRRMGDETYSGRLALLFNATEDLEFYTNVHILRGRGDAGGAWNFTPPNMLLCGGFQAQSCGESKNTELWDNRPNLNHQDQDWYSLEFNWKKPWGTITGIASYIKEYQAQTLNFDASELPYLDSVKYERASTKTAELRYAGEILPNLNIQFGGFFMRESNMYLDIKNLFFSAGGEFPQEGHFKSRSDAVFGQADWEVTPGLRLTGGLRYTHDRKELVSFYPLSVGADFNPGPISTIGGLRKSWSKPTFRLGADWQATDDAFVYATFARGYRAGGFNGRAGSLASASVPYEPEVADSYEIGTKLDFLDKRLRLNLAAFHVARKKLQVENLKNIVFNGIPVLDGVIDNAATAKIDGFEAEMTAKLGPKTRIGGTFGWLDARYDKFLTTCGGGVCIPGQIIDLSGKRLRRSPKYQFSVNAEHGVDLEFGSLTANVAYRWKSSQEFVIDNDPMGHQKSVGVLDASLTYKTPDERFSLTAYGKNLTNVQYKEFAFIVNSLGFVFGSYNRPVEWGLQAGYKF